MSTQPKKIGPYGGQGGNPFDTISTPTALVSVEVWSNNSYKVGDGIINGISFTYIDEKGQSVPAGPWGSETGKYQKINVGDKEHMVCVSGATDGTYVKSLALVNKKTPAEPYGTFSFCGAHLEDGLDTFNIEPNIVGFFGRCSDKLDAIGAYVIPVTPSTRTMPKKFIPCGGSGGDLVDISTPTKLVGVEVWSDVFPEPLARVINGISFTYENEKGQHVSSGVWGTKTGTHNVINLGDHENMDRVSGTTDAKYVTSLTFVKAGKQYGPYGAQKEDGLGTFSFPPNIVGFFGRCSDKLDAIGAYVIPLPLA